MFNTTQLDIIQFCAEECKRQRSGEVSVYNMARAWDRAERRYIVYHDDNTIIDHPNAPIGLEFISEIGNIVDPVANPDGFRQIPIGVSDGFNWIEKANWESVPRLLEILIESYYEGKLDPETLRQLYRGNENWGRYKYYKKAESAEDIFYFEYEEIHPFKDGNGRSGKIIYNYLRGTLDNPVMPPNFYGGSNP